MNKNNKGFIVVYLTGLLAFLAVILLFFQAKSLSSIKILDKYFDGVDSLYMTYSPINFVEQLLQQDSKQNNIDGIGDNWFYLQEAKSFAVNNGYINLKLQDAASIPNINLLFNGNAEKAKEFSQILTNYLNEKSIDKIIINDLLAWHNNNLKNKNIKNILLAADIKITPNYNHNRFNLLQENIGFLPIQPAIKINVNTVTPSYLATIFAGQQPSINNLTVNRKKQPVKSLSEFYEYLNIQQPTKAVEFTTQTTYFTSYINVNINGVATKVEALFERDKGKTVLRRLLWH